MNHAAAWVIVFACVSILGLGYFLVIPATFTRIYANVTDPGRNTTITNAVGLTNAISSTYAWIPISLAALAVVAVMVYLFRWGGG
jgi:hypothetical protein